MHALLGTALVLAAAAGTAPVDGTQLDTWRTPACPAVAGGNGALSYTTDEGATITPTVPESSPVTYGKVVALEAANRLVGLARDTVQVSLDAGCSWVPVHQGTVLDQFQLARGPGEVAYAWSPNDPLLLRVDGMAVSATAVPAEGDGTAGLAVDPLDDRHLRVVTRQGQIFETPDAGHTWTRVGRPPGADVFVVTAAFNPADLDHAVLGTYNEGAVFTHDAGRSWRTARGVGTHRAGANVFTVAFSPADHRTVWVEGYDLASDGVAARKLWLSTNGARSFREVLDGTRLRLTNGVVMAPHPHDPHVLYVVFGTWFGGYGTDVYRYDAATGSLSTAHNGYDDVSGIDFNPANPDVMYLGLAEER